jgi:virulence-associated protein VagC
MEAIRQTVKVKNHSFKITLPDNFNADEVDVIIMAKQDDFILTDEMKSILDERAKEDVSTYITAEESINRLKKKYGL